MSSMISAIKSCLSGRGIEDVDDWIPTFQRDSSDEYPHSRLIHDLSTQSCHAPRYVWLGHASTLAEFPSTDPTRPITILFDPILKDHCAPTDALGRLFKRRMDAPCTAKELGEYGVDAVVISHDHYDHLCIDTLRTIHDTSPYTKFFAPSGNAHVLESGGLSPERIVELDWWEGQDLHLDAKRGLSGEQNPQSTEPDSCEKTENESVKRKNEIQRSISDTSVQLSQLPYLARLPTSPSSDDLGLEIEITDNPSQKSGSDKVRITCTPAAHNSGRIMDNPFSIFSNEAKCATWVVQHSVPRSSQYTKDKKISTDGISPSERASTFLFGGDTGCGKGKIPGSTLFHDIAERFGPIDVCALPIAAGAASDRFNIPSVLVRANHMVDTDFIRAFNEITASAMSFADENHENHENQVGEEVSPVPRGFAIHHSTFGKEATAKKVLQKLWRNRDEEGIHGDWADGGFSAPQPGVIMSMDENLSESSLRRVRRPA